MGIISIENVVEQLNKTVYPITIIKYLLNKRKILNYFSKAAREDFEIRGFKYTINPNDCQTCRNKSDKNILCRQHTSIDRVLTAKEVAFDLDTKTFFCKNEIFKMVGNKLVVVYCPHTKLIEGDITDEKVRKVSPITIDDPNLKTLPEYSKVYNFLSTELIDKQYKCWFNKQFSLITTPKDRNRVDWSLIPNV